MPEDSKTFFGEVASQFRADRDRHGTLNWGHRPRSSSSEASLLPPQKPAKPSCGDEEDPVTHPFAPVEVHEAVGALNPVPVEPQFSVRPLRLIPATKITFDPRPNYLVENWLNHGSLSVLYGESGAGKTHVALDIAAHVAADASWMKSKIDSRGGCVVYIAAEGGRGVQNRILALRKAKPELSHFADRFFLVPSAVPLASDSERLLDAIGHGVGSDPVLIVVDTLARCFDGDENSAMDMNRFVAGADTLRERTGAHVLLVHHSGKDGSKGARGSSALRAAADTEILVTRNKDGIRASVTKQRDLASEGTASFELQPVFLGKQADGDEVWSALPFATESAPSPISLSRQQRIGLGALDQAIAQVGEYAAGAGKDDAAQKVDIDCWIGECRRLGITKSANDGAFRKAHTTVKRALKEKGLISFNETHIWRVN